MPPYYQPTSSVKNRITYFAESEPLGADEMRIIFMGSNPWAPRLSQAGIYMMVELGNTGGYSSTWAGLPAQHHCEPGADARVQ